MSIDEQRPTEANRRRANWALLALKEFGTHTGQKYFDGEDIESVDRESLQEVAGDLLGDLLHLARGVGLDPMLIIEPGYRAFEEEVAEEDLEPPAAVVRCPACDGPMSYRATRPEFECADCESALPSGMQPGPGQCWGISRYGWLVREPGEHLR